MSKYFMHYSPRNRLTVNPVRGFESHRLRQLRLLKKMQPLKPLLRQGFQPFQRTKSSTRRDGDAKGHFRDVG